ncbi:hypothetical protein GCM10010331_44970 [Streptomyces xanthochromogenes]|nr:hypothetical protein GCM10010331_44970 [Streptomyces xanthochromogenes]
MVARYLDEASAPLIKELLKHWEIETSTSVPTLIYVEDEFPSCGQCFQNSESIRVSDDMLTYVACGHTFRIP